MANFIIKALILIFFACWIVLSTFFTGWDIDNGTAFNKNLLGTLFRTGLTVILLYLSYKTIRYKKK